MEAVAGKDLRERTGRAGEQGIRLSLPEGLAAVLGKRCRGKGGARQLRRLVQDQVEGPLAMHLLSCAAQPKKIQARLEGETVVFS